MPDTRALPHPRKARQKSGLRVCDLARQADISVPAICRYERQGTYPQKHDLRARYLAALGLTETAKAG